MDIAPKNIFLGAPILFSVTVVIVNDMSGCFISLGAVGIDVRLSCLNSPEGVSVRMDESL